MANSDYLIAGNDEQGLEPLATGGGMLNPIKNHYLFRFCCLDDNFYFMC